MFNSKIIIIGTTASSMYGFRSDLIKQLVSLNYEVYAFISDYTEYDLAKIKNLGAIPIPYNINRGGLNPINDISSTLALVIKIKAISPDIVFSYFVKPVIFGTIAAKLAEVPKVVGMLEGLGYSFTNQPNGLSKKAKIVQAVQVALYKTVIPHLDDLIFLNSDDFKDLIEKFSIKVKNTHNLGGIGLNLTEFPFQQIPSTNESINFLFIGRLLKEKGIHEFVAAAKIVKNIYPIANFIVLGSTDPSNPGSLDQTELDLLIQTDLIQYYGYVDNISAWISESHVFVLPSYREGFPRSTQEAMAVGRPIITTDVPGCRETVEDGINGFLIPPFNADALANKMITFIEQPELINEMGRESRRIAELKFDVDEVNTRLINILNSKR